MLYKKLNDSSWLKAEREVVLPDGSIINESNQKDGWYYSITEPMEYLIWLESQKKLVNADVNNEKLKEYEV